MSADMIALAITSILSSVVGGGLALFGQRNATQHERVNLQLRLAHERQQLRVRMQADQRRREIEEGVSAIRDYQRASTALGFHLGTVMLAIDHSSEDAIDEWLRRVYELCVSIEASRLFLPEALRESSIGVQQGMKLVVDDMSFHVRQGRVAAEPLQKYHRCVGAFSEAAKSWMEGCSIEMATIN